MKSKESITGRQGLSVERRTATIASEGGMSGWTLRLPPDILERTRSMTLGQFRVMIALEQFARDKATCFPHNRTLSKSTGLSDRGLRKCLAELEEAGWILRVPTEHRCHREEIVLERRLDPSLPTVKLEPDEADDDEGCSGAWHPRYGWVNAEDFEEFDAMLDQEELECQAAGTIVPGGVELECQAAGTIVPGGVELECQAAGTIVPGGVELECQAAGTIVPGGVELECHHNNDSINKDKFKKDKVKHPPCVPQGNRRSRPCACHPIAPNLRRDSPT